MRQGDKTLPRHPGDSRRILEMLDTVLRNILFSSSCGNANVGERVQYTRQIAARRYLVQIAIFIGGLLDGRKNK
jgi:hypothetical protein